MANIPGHLRTAAEFFAPAFCASKEALPFAMAVIVFFASAGFLFSYLWTRLYLASAMAQADMTRNLRAEIRREQKEQERTDVDALTIARQQLSPAKGAPAVDIAAMKDAIVKATPSVRVFIFDEAWKVRHDNWRTNKEVMERTIPIFEALCDSDVSREFHRFHGQLGYALKDQRKPDWEAALRRLTDAIEIRGDWRVEGWVYYELNRAICRVMLDPHFAAGEPSSAEVRHAIIEDLIAIASSDIDEQVRMDPIAAWMKLNKVKPSELKSEG